MDPVAHHEPSFFDEPSIFDMVVRHVLQPHPRHRLLRAWSASCANGAEAYSIAMLLAEHLPDTPWEVIGTDASARVLARARDALYPMAAAASIPDALLRKYCQKGCDDFAGYLRVAPALRARVAFREASLLESLPRIGSFDVVIPRNVMLGADPAIGAEVVRRMRALVRPGGYVITGNPELQSALQTAFDLVEPSVHRRPPARGATGD